jgi:hypothetical protein
VNGRRRRKERGRKRGDSGIGNIFANLILV